MHMFSSKAHKKLGLIEVWNERGSWRQNFNLGGEENYVPSKFGGKTQI